MKNAIFEDLFVLELANNHWGSLERGLKIIGDFGQVVRFNNVRASIKLQFRDVDSFVHKDHRQREDVRYIKKTVATQMPWDSLRAMVKAVRAQSMLSMVTPFDETSVDKAVEFGVDILKLASSDIRDWILIEKIAATRKPVIASTGGSSLRDMDDLITFFNRRGIPFALNHCVSIYPSHDSEIELNQIDFLKNRYPDNVIGFSTHEQTDWQFSVMMAYAKGARTFERHVDIDYQGVPVSPYCTLPEQADQWFKAFKKAQEMCGAPGTAKRIPPEKEVKYLNELVRGVYARADLPAGHVLTDEDVYLAIPLLKGQLSCRELMRGEVLRAPVTQDAPINLGDIDSPYSADSALRRMIDDRGVSPLPAEPDARLRLASKD
ncbi:N-acetylneuraminate synthase family protein [Emcibacter sp. SYSU 3D8]|uniref:N-acetylneuraminate synthase family protein n=1 Tax=Emcibacter sp. SYSU 3D8 TaxID=3133969 RepID=UPI0031FF465C